MFQPVYYQNHTIQSLNNLCPAPLYIIIGWILAYPKITKGEPAMARLSNSHIIEDVKEITVAKMSNSSIEISDRGGARVAEFMQAIYDKLVELNEKEN